MYSKFVGDQRRMISGPNPEGFEPLAGGQRSATTGQRSNDRIDPGGITARWAAIPLGSSAGFGCLPVVALR